MLGPADASIAANVLGQSYASQGRYDEAFALFGSFLEDARSRGDQFEQVRFGMLLANAQLDHGDPGRARLNPFGQRPNGGLRRPVEIPQLDGRL